MSTGQHRIKYLPLPDPWTLDTLDGYVDALAGYLREYIAIAEYGTHNVFTRGLPVEWVPENVDCEGWLARVNGSYTDSIPDNFSKFVSLSRTLPFADLGYAELKAGEARRGMSPKKDHEVDAMITFLDKITSTESVVTKNVLDVGSGLGYLSLELSRAGYAVTGIKGDPERVVKTSETTNVECLHKMVTSFQDLNVLQDPLISLSIRISRFYCSNVRCLRRFIFEYDSTLPQLR
jgi:Tellurite resistance protein TehB